MYIARYKTNDKIDDILLTSDGKYLTGLYFENYEKEWVLDGATVLYGSASELRATLEYDFLQEKTLFTKGFRWRKSFIILQSLFQDYGKSISLVRKIQERRQYF